MSHFDWNDRLPNSLRAGFQPPSEETEEEMKRRHHAELVEYERFATSIRSEYTKPIDKSRAVQQLSRLKQQMRDRHVSEEAVLSGSERTSKKAQILLSAGPSHSVAPEKATPTIDDPVRAGFLPPQDARGLIGGALAHANRMAEQASHKVLHSTAHRTAMDNEIIERYVKKAESRSGPGARFGFIQRINQKAAALGKRVINIEADNNCLYNSLIAGLHGPSEDSGEAVKRLRGLVGDYVTAHADVYAEMINVMVQMSLAAYVEGIKAEAMGDELECSVVAKVLGVRIHLVTPDDDVRTFDPEGSPETDIWIAYYPSYTILGDAHYNVLL